MATRRISIMGSTGSIGKSALDVVRHANANAEQTFQIVALAAGSDAEGLAAQAIAFNAEIAVISDESQLPTLKTLLAGTDIEAAAGETAIAEAAARPVERMLAAIVGAAGLKSTISAIRAGNDVAIANKESIVCGGKLILSEARRRGVSILPVDSEHSAILQSMHSGNRNEVEKIPLPCSGGPFRTWTTEKMAGVTPIIAHPERYKPIQDDINIVAEWLAAGCIIQVDAGSPLGYTSLGRS